MRTWNEEAESHPDPHLSDIDCRVVEHNTEEVSKNDFNWAYNETTNPVKRKDILVTIARIYRKKDPKNGKYAQ